MANVQYHGKPKIFYSTQLHTVSYLESDRNVTMYTKRKTLIVSVICSFS